MFLRPDLPENKLLIQQAITVELNPGDVLFFHSRLFHAAGRNLSDMTKLSVVFTYHEASNKPIRDTRSARFPSIVL
jgi:phytanoyl-CoA hydroxylase